MKIRIDGAPAFRSASGRPGARIADANDKHLRPQRLEVVTLGKMSLQRADQLFLDVQHSSANLADRVMVITAGELVVDRTFAEVRGVHRARRREGIKRSVD